MKTSRSTTDLIKLIAMFSVCLCSVIGMCTMVIIPTNEYNKEIRSKLMDLNLVLAGGILVNLNNSKSTQKETDD